ncbi:MAG: DEAD/DEAH box helicase [Ilumatobacteraceae bacterium]
MTRTIRLRPWQKAAFDAYVAADGPDFLAVATPGAGKTTFALAAARYTLGERPGRLVVVAPTAHLKIQWAHAADAVGLYLDPAWSPAAGPAADLHGIVTTYQQVASAAPALRALATGSLVIFDEIHHAADERAWGDSIRLAFGAADRRLALSGTPFRSDTSPIPFVDYVLDEARPDYTYGYGDALRDGRVVRPVYFPRVGGDMEWVAPDGAAVAASFDDALDAPRSAQRLRTALSLDGQWLPTVLRSAHERLTAIRLTDPDAGGLVIATDQDHARGIAEMMRWRLRVDPVVVTSDDPIASARIARFGAGRDPWLVAVRMVSEGVDIPRLAVGVYATTTTTELFFRQAVGRFVRWRRGGVRQQAFLYLPDDPRLRARAFQIADERRHSLRRDGRADDEPAMDGAFDELADTERHPSLFSVISAVATDHEEPDAPWDVDLQPADDAEGEHGFELELADPPRLAPAPSGAPGVTLVEHKRQLRDSNSTVARELVHVTGWPHARVNAELNRRAGITRVTQATAEQLERRLRHAESWLRRA